MNSGWGSTRLLGASRSLCIDQPCISAENSVFLRFSVFLRNSVFCTFDLVGAAVNSRETLGKHVIDKVKLGSSEGIGEDSASPK